MIGDPGHPGRHLRRPGPRCPAHPPQHHDQAVLPGQRRPARLRRAGRYTWTPGGTLTGTAPAGGTGALDLTDQHTDLVAQFTAAGTVLSASRSYGPWGAATANSASPLTGSLGYQSQYTSPVTGQTSMGSRWYNPANGSFGNKDTVSNNPVPDSASASPFAYAADNPLTGTDPTGHGLCLSASCLVNDATGAASALVGAAGAVCVIPGCKSLASAVKSALAPPSAAPVQQATLLPVITPTKARSSVVIVEEVFVSGILRRIIALTSLFRRRISRCRALRSQVMDLPCVLVPTQ